MCLDQRGRCGRSAVPQPLRMLPPPRTMCEQRCCQLCNSKPAPRRSSRVAADPPRGAPLPCKPLKRATLRAGTLPTRHPYAGPVRRRGRPARRPAGRGDCGTRESGAGTRRSVLHCLQALPVAHPSSAPRCAQGSCIYCNHTPALLGAAGGLPAGLRSIRGTMHRAALCIACKLCPCSDPSSAPRCVQGRCHYCYHTPALLGAAGGPPAAAPAAPGTGAPPLGARHRLTAALHTLRAPLQRATLRAGTLPRW